MPSTLTIPRPKTRRASSAEVMRLLELVRRKDDAGLWPDGFDKEIYLVEDWDVFAPGFWNGEWWTAEHIRDMAENYAEFLEPRNSKHPFLVPIVNEQHDPLRYGWVVACKVAPNGWLNVTLAVNRVAAHLVDSSMLDHSSIEFFDKDQIRDAGLPTHHADGRPRLAVLRAVSLTGSQLQAVLGQPPAPRPYRVFKSSAPYRSFTARIGNMDPAFQAFLQQLSQLVQGAMSGGAAPPPGGADGDPMTAPATEMTAEMPPLEEGAMNEMPAGARKAFTSLYATVKKDRAVLQRTQAQLEAERKQLAADRKTVWEADVKKFVAEQKRQNRINPNEDEEKVTKALLAATDPSMQEFLRGEIQKRPAHRMTQRIFPQTIPTGSVDKTPGNGENLSPAGRTVDQLRAMVMSPQQIAKLNKTAGQVAANN